MNTVVNISNASRVCFSASIVNCAVVVHCWPTYTRKTSDLNRSKLKDPHHPPPSPHPRPPLRHCCNKRGWKKWNWSCSEFRISRGKVPVDADKQVQYSSVQFLDRLGRRGKGGGWGGFSDTRERFSRDPLSLSLPPPNTHTHSPPREATVSDSGMDRDVHPLTMSIHGVVGPPSCPEGWFWRGCRDVAWRITRQTSQRKKRRRKKRGRRSMFLKSALDI